MTYTFEELKAKLLEMVYAVYQVFQNHFREDHVDLQGIPADNIIWASIHRCSNNQGWPSSIELTDDQFQSVRDYLLPNYPKILVYWPTVTITNENDKSVTIQDLYAKIVIDLDGRIPHEQHGFRLNRATYTPEQIMSDYMHSHIPGIPRNPTEFLEPCMGTGPIKNTIVSLKREFDETMWMLFCQELSAYVTVESLRGVPYRKLENIGAGSQYCSGEYDTRQDYHYKWLSFFPEEWRRGFLHYYLQNSHLSLHFHQGRFAPGMTLQQFIVDVSNAFIAYYNEHPIQKGGRPCGTDELLHDHILYKVIYSQGDFYTPRSGHADVDREGMFVCQFKGNPVYFHMTSSNAEEEVHDVYILNSGIIQPLMNNILRVINNRFENENHHRRTNISEAAETATTHRKAIYV